MRNFLKYQSIYEMKEFKKCGNILITCAKYLFEYKCF